MEASGWRAPGALHGATRVFRSGGQLFICLIYLSCLSWLALFSGACFFSLDETLWRTRADARRDGLEADASSEVPIGADGIPELQVDALQPVNDALDAPVTPVPDLLAPDRGIDACTDVCSEGATQCAGNSAMQTCAQQAGGCMGWDPAVPCASDEACSAGQCNVACSASGVPTACDPVAAGGCLVGSCYLTGAGPACVCPEGAVAAGDPCATTVRCSPGLVCAGTVQPGICRPLCNPLQPNCPGSWTCLFITIFPQYGYCVP